MNDLYNQKLINVNFYNVSDKCLHNNRDYQIDMI